MSCQLKKTAFCETDCNEAIEKKCASHKPFPPRMTDYEYAEKQTELFKNIPEELRGVISGMAYKRGHSAGNEEMLIHLTDLVSAFEKPIKEFEERIRKSK